MFRRFRIRKSSAKFPVIKTKPRRKKVKLYFFFLLTIIFVAGAFIIYRFDKRMLPTVLAMAEHIATDKINESINFAIKDVAAGGNIKPEDFYSTSVDEQGMVNSLTVNTILVNEVCGTLAVEISNGLYRFDPEALKVPIGSAFGIKVFSNLGPVYSVKILPLGNAMVDYETKFESVGINQTNFQIWLNIESRVKIVNPLQDKETTVKRKIALINTVFSGKVPDTYLNNIQQRRE